MYVSCLVKYYIDRFKTPAPTGVTIQIIVTKYICPEAGRFCKYLSLAAGYICSLMLQINNILVWSALSPAFCRTLIRNGNHRHLVCDTYGITLIHIEHPVSSICQFQL